MTATSPSLEGEALELFGAIVSDNVNSLAAVNAHLYALKDREARGFAKAFIDMYEAIERIPDTIRSSYLDGVLQAGYYTCDAAYRLLEEPPS